jgi:hypothetical protein
MLLSCCEFRENRPTEGCSYFVDVKDNLTVKNALISLYPLSPSDDIHAPPRSTWAAIAQSV